MRRIAGRDRPLVALDAVDRDGHHLLVLVDGDGNFGLGGAGGGEQHQTRECNEEATHVKFGLRALNMTLYRSAALTVPRINMPEDPAFVPAACFCIVNARGWRKKGGDGAQSGAGAEFFVNGRPARNLSVTSALHMPIPPRIRGRIRN